MYYGASADLLGFLIARIEGKSLGALLERRIFGPLGMKDTGFIVPPDKRDRRARTHGFDDQGRLIKRITWGSDPVLPERPQNMTYESGGAGLWSTLNDYVKFARLFLGDGAIDGVRLLLPETLSMMIRNQLTDAQRQESWLLGQKPFAVGRGFGLGVSVVLESDPSDFIGGVVWARLVGPVLSEAGGGQIPRINQCSFSWRTTWSICLKWHKGSGSACGLRSSGFRPPPWPWRENPPYDRCRPMTRLDSEQPIASRSEARIAPACQSAHKSRIPGTSKLCLRCRLLIAAGVLFPQGDCLHSEIRISLLIEGGEMFDGRPVFRSRRVENLRQNSSRPGFIPDAFPARGWLVAATAPATPPRAS
jgi:hypothetical protein